MEARCSSSRSASECEPRSLCDVGRGLDTPLLLRRDDVSLLPGPFGPPTTNHDVLTVVLDAEMDLRDKPNEVALLRSGYGAAEARLTRSK